MEKFRRTASILVIAIGVALVAIGLFIAVPGDHLTTYKSLADEAGYSYIKEYVGGDAYNYIIGASLVGGHIAGTLTMKAVFVVGGVLTSCIGLLCLASIHHIERHVAQHAEDTASPAYTTKEKNDGNQLDL